MNRIAARARPVNSAGLRRIAIAQYSLKRAAPGTSRDQASSICLRLKGRIRRFHVFRLRRTGLTAQVLMQIPVNAVAMLSIINRTRKSS